MTDTSSTPGDDFVPTTSDEDGATESVDLGDPEEDED